ncbi:hypothetical protein SAMD00023353_0701640 [Rosellinia necatrix]|uniref:Uncharacterized protein n=1 Tax=Rosellinia necatrix TaxID=77044 RepID=A0A1S8A6Z2_ROSNE|nr:hypothetical protein SAMD00023353_0701640 [Rosellinia necatrix]
MPESSTAPRRTSVSSLASANTLVEEEHRAPEPTPIPRRTHKRSKTSENIAKFGKRMSWSAVDRDTLAKVFSTFPC